MTDTRAEDDLPDVAAEADQVDDGLDDPALAELLVRRAGALAARLRHEGLTTGFKTSVSDVVTAADRAAEMFVTRALRRVRPDDSILGEEGASHEGTSGRRWVIDPVDGTYNFVSGLPLWCSALALVGHDLHLGAVHQPVTGETWLGGWQPGRMLPTTLDGVTVPPLAPKPLAECSIATYVHPSTLDEADVREPWLALTAGAATVRILGSGSCDLAGVAGGRIGVWAQHSTAEWDWLPGQALVDAAGGETEVVQHRGHRWFLAGNHQALAELVARLHAS